ncbi:MAG TPA: hypothetical protein VF529_06430 [Solirubrobacteraceae bacterium]
MLALPAPALAQQSSSPAAEQYVERVPTAGGPRPSSGDRKGGAGKLPPEVREKLREQGGADADDLGAIATEPGLGAPQAPASSGSKPRAGGDGSAAPSSPVSSADRGRKGAIEGIADAAFGGESQDTTLLVIGLLAMTAVVAGFGIARRRSDAA